MLCPVKYLAAIETVSRKYISSRLLNHNDTFEEEYVQCISNFLERIVVPKKKTDKSEWVMYVYMGVSNTTGYTYFVIVSRDFNPNLVYPKLLIYFSRSHALGVPFEELYQNIITLYTKKENQIKFRKRTYRHFDDTLDAKEQERFRMYGLYAIILSIIVYILFSFYAGNNSDPNCYYRNSCLTTYSTK